MAFTAKILSWRFRLLKRRPTKEGSRAPQALPPPPSYAPAVVVKKEFTQQRRGRRLRKRHLIICAAPNFIALSRFHLV